MILYKVYRISGANHRDIEYYVIRDNATRRLSELQHGSELLYGLETYEVKDGDQFELGHLK